MTNKTLKEVFSYIEKNSEFIFIYHGKDIDLNKKVSLDVYNQPVDKIFEQLFQNTDINYVIKDRQVIIKRDPSKSHLVPNIVSQEKKQIRGLVQDHNGEPLIGVTVLVKGTTIGTLTDADGKYNIAVPSGSSVVFSYVGYMSKTVAIGSQNIINIVLEEDAGILDEVVVVGYGTQKKVNLTGAVASADSKVLENRPVTSAVSALQGTISGLFINPRNGNPNENLSFNIRGTTSINGGSPLVLIDGVESNLKLLNPNDIENVTVLKDAAASSIYGVRAAFGVVLITTKQGKADKRTQVSYSGNMSWSKATVLPEFVDNSYDHAKFVNDALAREKIALLYNPKHFEAIEAYSKDPSLPDYYIEKGQYFNNGYTDWRKELTSDFSPKQQHNISISGGSGKTTFYASGGYVRQEGVLKIGNDIFDRFTTRLRVENRPTDWSKFGLKMTYATSKMNRPFDYSNNVYHNIVFSSPLRGGEWKGDPAYPEYDKFIGYSFEDQNMEIRLRKGGRIIEKSSDIIVTPTIDITPIKNWNIHVDFSYKKSNTDNSENKKKIPGLITNKFVETESNTANNYYKLTKNQSDYYSLNMYTDYSLTLAGKHKIKLMAGYNQENTKYIGTTGQLYNMLSGETPSLSLGTGDQLVTESGFEWALRGGFARVNYNYDDRYLVELNGRYDATSRFPKNDRFVFVPSFSLGWRLSEESFMGFVKPLFENIKLRGSYGKLGNQLLSSSQWGGNKKYYPFIPFLTKESSNYYYLFNEAAPIYVNPAGLTPASLTWETVSTLNGGLDLLMLSSRLEASFDIFERRTSDMLISQDYPELLGAVAPVINQGELKTKGWELSINWRDKVGKDFQYQVGLNLFDAQANISKWAGPTTTGGNYVGKKIGEIWGYETEGIFQSEDEIKNHASQTHINKGEWTPGDIKYKDLNGDGKINNGADTPEDSGDRKIIGNTTPRYNYGIRAEASYKGLFFNMFFQGVGKRDYWPSSQAFWPVSTQYFNTQKWFITDSWSEDNRDAYFPIPRARNTKNQQAQTKYLQDASYIRLKNLTIGYQIPTEWAKKVSLSKAQIYFSGENLWEHSNVKGPFDPEGAANNGGMFYPYQRVFSVGIDLTF